jgi:hypothetical protein
MKTKTLITILITLIVLISATTSLFGILSNCGPGRFHHESIRGKTIEIYGKGIYQHMSADVAVQGIGHDYVTLFVAIPLLIVSLLLYWKNSSRGQFLMAGILGYFFVTFLFYTAMGMYNIMFLAYVTLLGLSFFSLLNLMLSFDLNKTAQMFDSKTPTRFVGGFLIFNSIAIALMWLNIVVPPLLDGTIYPESLQHYTTLIVQGFDLGLLLPASFIIGWLLIRRRPLGYLLATVYIVFLSLLMMALTSKIIAMGLQGQNIIPVIFIIPAFGLISITCASLMLKSFKNVNQ